jgi:flavodoxin I
MRVLVVYHSETSNTEKVAQAIHQEASKDYEAHLKKIGEAYPHDLEGYDLVFLGAPCHDNDLSRPARRFLDALPRNPRYKLAGFYTHATLPRDAQLIPGAAEYFERWAAKGPRTLERACQEKGIRYLGLYNCMGAPSPGIEDFIRRTIIPPEDWETYAQEVRRHPTPEDLRRAREFAREKLKG